VKRDAGGKIIAVYQQQTGDGLEEISDEHQDLRDFVKESGLDAGHDKELIESDLGLARVLEDLIDVLIQNKVMQFTDLPQAAQKKLLARRGLRKEFAYVEDLFGGDETDFEGAGSDDEGGFL